MSSDGDVKKQKESKKIVAKIFGDVLYNDPLHRKIVRFTAKSLWNWNRLLRTLWFVLPIVLTIYGMWAWQTGAFSIEIVPGTIDALNLFNIGFILTVLLLIHATFTSYAFIFTYLDFFGQVNRTPQKSVRGLDIIERIRREEVHKTGMVVGLAGIILALFLIGTMPSWVPGALLPESSPLLTIYNVAAWSSGLMLLVVGGYLGIRFGIRATWGWRWLFIVYFVCGVAANVKIWGPFLYSAEPIPRTIYTMCFYISVSLVGVLFSYVLINWDIFIHGKSIREVYQPDTVPLITPRNIFEFIRTFSDPLSELQLARRMLVLNTVSHVDELTAYSKLLVLLHFYKSEMRVRTGNGSDMDKEKSNSSEESLSYSKLLDELAEVFHPNTEIALQKSPSLEELLGKKGLIEFECQLYSKYAIQCITEGTVQWKNFLAWVFGLEEKVQYEKRRELWNAFDLKDLKKHYPQQMGDILNAPYGTTLDAYTSALKFVGEFFTLVSRLYIAVSSGEIFSLDAEKETEATKEIITVKNAFFDVEATREIFQDNDVNIMVLLFNRSNTAKIATIRCIAPGFNPPEIGITLPVLEKDIALHDFIEDRTKTFTDETKKREEIENLFRTMNFSVPSKAIMIDDLISVIAHILKSTRIAWFRLHSPQVGDKPINILLLDKYQQVIDGKTITIRTLRNMDEKLRNLFGAISAILAAGVSLQTVLSNLPRLF